MNNSTHTLPLAKKVLIHTEDECNTQLPGASAYVQDAEMAFHCAMCPRELKSDTCPPCGIQHRSY